MYRLFIYYYHVSVLIYVLVLQFLSDVVHLLEDYKMDEGSSRVAELETELRSAKDDKKKVENRLVELEGRSAEISRTNTKF